MSQNELEERRREFSRIPNEVAIEISQLQYPLASNPDDNAAAKNIAENGICLTSPKAYEVGAVVSLKIDLKGWRQHLKNVTYRLDENKARAPLTALAEIVWCKAADTGHEIGLKFVDIYEDDLEALKNYLTAVRESM